MHFKLAQHIDGVSGYSQRKKKSCLNAVKQQIVIKIFIDYVNCR